MQNHKLTLFSWGNFVQTTRISAKVCYKHVSSMKLSYFLEIFLQQSYMQVCSLQYGLFTAMGLSGLGVKTLKNHERMELSWANNVYNTEFSVEIRLEHGFAIENTYFL